MDPITPTFRTMLDKDRYHNHRLGSWLPSDRRVIVDWTKTFMKRVRKIPNPVLDPTLLELKALVDTDAILKPLSENMFNEVPNLPPYNKDPEGNKEIRSFDDMLQAFNVLLTEGPAWNTTANMVGLIGCPFNAILDWPMATASGYMFFLYPNVNLKLKAMLHQWTTFLQTNASIKVLSGEDGWLVTGLKPMLDMGNSTGQVGVQTHFTFPELYKCPNPSDVNTYGFTNWDQFFTRSFNVGIRPLPVPEDDHVIVHACESAPLQFPVSNVQLTDNFYGKNQNYSLIDMMNQNPLAEQFVGGTVYQAFLSCLSYHKWHAPCSGTIVSYELVAGTYYSQNIYQTFFGHWPHNPISEITDSDKPDPAGPTWSQPYIAAVAARGLIFIQADNPDIGLVCFIAIGMTDTSGCEFSVTKNQHVNKGDELGMFHFGGSSHCLIFGPHVNIDWEGIPPRGDPLYPETFSSTPPANMPNHPVKSMLARVIPKPTKRNGRK